MNLWPVEHFFPHFYNNNPVKKWGKKCSTGQSFIGTKVTSYKIHTLAKAELLAAAKNSSFICVSNFIDKRIKH